MEQGARSLGASASSGTLRSSYRQQHPVRRRGHALRVAALGGGSSSSSTGKGPFDSRSHQQQSMLHALSSAERVGAEYGEGFIQFRLSGERAHLDVDTLNEQLRIYGADRMRHAMRPDEAFGLIFNLDNVLADTRAMQLAAWRRVAADEGLHFPPAAQARRAMFDVRPERAVTEVLQWTRDWKRAQALAWQVASAYAQLLGEVQAPLPGVLDWLQLMAKNNVPCALVSGLDRLTLNALLERLGVRHLFTATVCEEDGMDTLSQSFLSAAIKLGRPPDQCIVFGACPATVTAAHNCTMKAVAIQGPLPGYQLKNADLTCSSLGELTVYNLRRLFANRGAEFMDLRKQALGKRPPGRRLRNATADDD
ncbi:hypothetical protein N2152v2_011222 [Parachlorella kessleri]